MITRDQTRRILQGALMAYSHPLTVDALQKLFINEEDPDNLPDKKDILALLNEISQETCGEGFELVEVGSGWRYQVCADLAPWVNKLWEEKPQRYSRALLETLSIIAYRQPITRGDIEEIRGVAVSSHIIKTLTEREWVQVVGHRDVPGRPSLYATTKEFLDYFNINSLEQLPSLKELADIDSLNPELDLSDKVAVAEQTEAETEAETETETEHSVEADNSIAVLDRDTNS